MSSNSLNDVFKSLWIDYSKLNPQAPKIHQLLEDRGEKVLNDHVAFRTFDHPSINVEALARVFLERGYKESGQYRFEQKKLMAKHYEPSDPQLPKVFISELICSELSESSQELIQTLTNQLSEGFSKEDEFLWSGRPWRVDSAVYEKLAEESEYAAWMAAFGFRANHFTVNFNELKSFNELSELNEFLKSEGFPLNSSGGEIKGGPSELLEQSSTLAAKIEVSFEDKTLTIPSCYYEFARRYPGKDGKLFQGFVTQSADKIFESTDRQQA